MGFGAELLFLIALGLLMLGPERLHTMLVFVARAKAEFDKASRAVKSQLTRELEAAAEVQNHDDVLSRRN